MDDSIFRGNCQQAKLLNAIGEGIESLCETEIGGEGEPTKKMFPVRSQTTWFRLVHKCGSIKTFKIFANDEQAEFNTEIYDEQGRFLQNAHGTATYADDGVRGFKLIETAESRSVARALSYAGFGCQLNLGYFDEGEPGGPDGSYRVIDNGQYKSGGNNNGTNDKSGDGHTMQPGQIDGQQRVAAQQSVLKDIQEQDALTKQVAVKPQLAVVTKATPQEEPVIPETGDQRNSENVAKSTADRQPMGEPAKSDCSGKINTEQPELKKEDERVKADSNESPHSNVTERKAEPKNSAEDKPAGKGNDGAEAADKTASDTIYQLVKKQFEDVKSNPTKINNAYFTADDVNGNGKYINRQKAPTHMDAMELQQAISVLEANKDSYKYIPAPLHENSERYGMTFEDLVNDASGTGKNLIAALSEMYRKDNALGFAAALICTKVNNLTLVEDPAA